MFNKISKRPSSWLWVMWMSVCVYVETQTNHTHSHNYICSKHKPISKAMACTSMGACVCLYLVFSVCIAWFLLQLWSINEYWYFRAGGGDVAVPKYQFRKSGTSGIFIGPFLFSLCFFSSGPQANFPFFTPFPSPFPISLRSGLSQHKMIFVLLWPIDTSASLVFCHYYCSALGCCCCCWHYLPRKICVFVCIGPKCVLISLWLGLYFTW